MVEAKKLGLLAVVLGVALMGCGVSDPQTEGTPDDSQTASAELRKNDPCYVVRCAAGTHCVSKGQTAACVANSTRCNSDSDCTLYDNYCGGCSCDALLSGTTPPVCSTAYVNCFAQPCVNRVAVCKAGACAVQFQ